MIMRAIVTLKIELLLRNHKLTFGTFEAISGNRRTGLHFSKIMYFVNTSIKLPGVSPIFCAIG
jgi:hypothetical protein